MLIGTNPRIARSSRVGRGDDDVASVTEQIRLVCKGSTMNKDRVEGAAKELKGSVKEAAGKLTGDAKLKTEGKADKVAGKVQNAVGGAEDAVKDRAKR
jgi:uncharacterized protein YjbJ (UPF0337 family)